MKKFLSFFCGRGAVWLYLSILAMAVCPTMVSVLAALIAKKEGYEQISALFQKTADNEKEHAKMWFKELNGLGDTAENLLHAAEGENYEWTDT